MVTRCGLKRDLHWKHNHTLSNSEEPQDDVNYALVEKVVHTLKQTTNF